MPSTKPALWSRSRAIHVFFPFFSLALFLLFLLIGLVWFRWLPGDFSSSFHLISWSDLSKYHVCRLALVNWMDGSGAYLVVQAPPLHTRKPGQSTPKRDHREIEREGWRDRHACMNSEEKKTHAHIPSIHLHPRNPGEQNKQSFYHIRTYASTYIMQRNSSIDRSH